MLLWDLSLVTWSPKMHSTSPKSIIENLLQRMSFNQWKTFAWGRSWNFVAGFALIKCVWIAQSSIPLTCGSQLWAPYTALEWPPFVKGRTPQPSFGPSQEGCKLLPSPWAKEAQVPSALAIVKHLWTQVLSMPQTSEGSAHNSGCCWIACVDWAGSSGLRLHMSIFKLTKSSKPSVAASPSSWAQGIP